MQFSLINTIHLYILFFFFLVKFFLFVLCVYVINSALKLKRISYKCHSQFLITSILLESDSIPT